MYKQYSNRDLVTTEKTIHVSDERELKQQMREEVSSEKAPCFKRNWMSKTTYSTQYLPSPSVYTCFRIQISTYTLSAMRPYIPTTNIL
jgi:hypothetical protein